MTHALVADATPQPAPPGAALEVTIECTRAPRDRFGVLHTAAIRPDWTVVTPHDLDAERVASAFGGWSSCLNFAERVVPAYRRLLGVMTRAHPLDQDPLAQDPKRRWLTSASPGCCPRPRAFDSLETAVRHEMSAPHLAGVFGTQHWSIESLSTTARRIWSESSDSVFIAGGSDGYRELWDRGIHPTEVERIAVRMPAGARPLSVSFFTNVVYRGLDVEALAQAASVFPTPEFADWFARRSDPRSMIPAVEVAALRDLGLASRDAMIAMDAGVDAAMIGRLAAETYATATTIARWRALWATVGCAPTGPHFRLLSDHRVLHVLPRAVDIDAVCARAARMASGAVDRTEAAIMLAIEPSPRRVLTAIARGVRSATDPRLLR